MKWRHTLFGLSLDFNIRKKGELSRLTRWSQPVNIVKRFKTGAMSFGSISQEAHECLALAMNATRRQVQHRRGRRTAPDTHWPVRTQQSSAIKQVASARFGVTSRISGERLRDSDQDGAGCKARRGRTACPGGKVYPWVAKTRHSTPGVSLDLPAAAPRYLFH